MLLASFMVACQAQPVTGGATATETAVLQRIEAEVGAASCQSSTDCRTLPIGQKACGGPVRWLAWSTRVSTEERLLPLAQDLAQRQRQREMGEGRMSTCSVVPDPGAQCDAGRCVLARGGLTK